MSRNPNALLCTRTHTLHKTFQTNEILYIKFGEICSTITVLVCIRIKVYFFVTHKLNKLGCEANIKSVIINFFGGEEGRQRRFRRVSNGFELFNADVVPLILLLQETFQPQLLSSEQNRQHYLNCTVIKNAVITQTISHAKYLYKLLE
jgi:predicted chitinase